jgi:hypothetical protein
MWTIHDIEVILHLFCSTAPWPRGQTDAYKNSVHKLGINGMVKNGRVTPKGCTFITMLQKTPAPVEGFFDPRIREDAA